MVRTVVTPEDKMKTSVNGFFFEQTLKASSALAINSGNIIFRDFFGNQEAAKQSLRGATEQKLQTSLNRLMTQDFFELIKSN